MCCTDFILKFLARSLMPYRRLPAFQQEPLRLIDLDIEIIVQQMVDIAELEARDRERDERLLNEEFANQLRNGPFGSRRRWNPVIFLYLAVPVLIALIYLAIYWFQNGHL